jgi:hypothetical protein
MAIKYLSTIRMDPQSRQGSWKNPRPKGQQRIQYLPDRNYPGRYAKKRR